MTLYDLFKRKKPQRDPYDGQIKRLREMSEKLKYSETGSFNKKKK